MSIQHLAWASEQSSINPGAKLLAIFISSQADIFGRLRFAAQDAAAWCCFSQIDTAERFTYELANNCGLTIVKSDRDYDILTFEVIVPSAKNHGVLL